MKYILRFGLIIALLFTSLEVAFAAGPYHHSQGDCASSVPKGASWTDWYSTAYNDVTVRMSILWWNGSGYVFIDSGTNSATGTTGIAIVNRNQTYRKGSWKVYGNHNGYGFNVFSANTQASFTCP